MPKTKRVTGERCDQEIKNQRGTYVALDLDSGWDHSAFVLRVHLLQPYSYWYNHIFWLLWLLLSLCQYVLKLYFILDYISWAKGTLHNNNNQNIWLYREETEKSTSHCSAGEKCTHTCLYESISETHNTHTCMHTLSDKCTHAHKQTNKQTNTH